MTHNIRALRQYYYQVQRTWFWWLRRRGGRSSLNWESFQILLTRHPLASPRIVHDLYARANALPEEPDAGNLLVRVCGGLSL